VSGTGKVAPRESSPGEPAAAIQAGSCATSAAEGYERWAPTYDQAPNPLLSCEERHLVPLLPELRDKPILDLACGTGRWLEKLVARRGYRALGVDRSEAMLRVAKQKSAIQGRLMRADCEKLPFRSAAFDLAICSFAVGHIRDLASMVRELARVVRPAGEVFVSDLHPEAYGRGWRVGFRDESIAIQIEMQPRTAEEIVRAFYANGFECLTYISLCLGRSERPIFARAGKAHLFAQACQLPAVLVCHFKRLSDRSGQSPARDLAEPPQ
jgi:ubiquinone/menaquinone biosynthesis C-methylase UbiE